MRTVNVIFVLLSMFFLLACHDMKNPTHALSKSEKQLSFALDPNTRSSILALFPYLDKNKKEYLTFQNPGKNELLFYNMNSCKLDFKINPDIEGANGVGFFVGYYIHNLDSIFLTTQSLQEITLIDKNAIIKDKIQYEESIDKVPLARYYSTSSIYNPIVLINDALYITPGCNRWAEVNPMCAFISLENKNVNTLPLSYPFFQGAVNKAKRAGVEESLSRCFDGKHFVYSFYFDEDIYIASLDHKSVDKIKIRSKFIDKVRMLDDFGNLTLEDMCANPNYGNLLFDKYRNVYYRVAYPEAEIEKSVKGMELLQYGRKNFSIIILDKDFNIIGETLFPDYTYNSNVMFIREDGLYISNSHYMNPNFSDDILSFVRFNLVEQ